MSLVGLIANPASGKDIRRLVAHGSVFDNQEKVRIIRRLLLGLEAIGVDEVCYLPDYSHLTARALDQVDLKLKARPVDLRIRGDQEDSVQGARMMEAQGAGCIVTLGGDGTNRAVTKGNASAPILPISTGTNNVFPYMIESTVAGLAAGLVARGLVDPAECIVASTKLEVLIEGRVVDLALVDAAVYDDLFIGSRAVWEMDKIRQIFLNRAHPDSIGLSSIGGLIQTIGPDEPRGLYLEPGLNGQAVTAPVMPGVIETVRLDHHRLMKMGQEIEVRFQPCLLALDGEREVEIKPGQRAAVRLAEGGPRIIDVTQTMAVAGKKRILAPE